MNYNNYYDQKGYGRRHLEDKIHQSNTVFVSKEPFAKRETTRRISSTPVALAHDHRRYPKHHRAKINSANPDKYMNLEFYQKQKQKLQPNNSLIFESELYKEPKPKEINLIATEPYRHAFIHPWKYSYKTIDYQTCSEHFRRAKYSCIDLSKY